MPLTYQGPAPYAPRTSVTTVIDKHRHQGLATPVDATRLVQIGVSETLVPRTLKALRLLDLLNEDGTLTQTMIDLGKVPPADYQATVAEWVRSVYAPIFQAIGNDLNAVTPKDIDNAFFGYEPKGQLARMVTLFTGLCEYAGIVDKAPTKAPTTNSSSKPSVMRPAKKSTGKTASGGGKTQTPPPPLLPPVDPTAFTKSVTLPSGVAVTLTVTGNPLSLEAEERKYVFTVVDALDAKPEAKP